MASGAVNPYRRPAGPKRGPRVTKFFHVLWTDCPVPCADVLHSKKIVDCPPDLNDLHAGMLVSVTWTKDTVKKGKILELGSERGLKLIRVDGTGKPTTGAGIPCRRECELRQKVSTRRELVEAEANQNLYDTIVAPNSLTGTTLAPRMPPFSKAELLQHVNALPPVPSPEQVHAILQRLPCFAATSSVDIRLVIGYDVFINNHLLGSLHRMHLHRPGVYMSGILHELLPDYVMRLPYITAKGKGPTNIALPKDFFRAITIYIDHRTKYQPINGWANSINCMMNNVRQTGKMQLPHQHLSALEGEISDPGNNNIPGPNIVGPHESELSVRPTGQHTQVQDQGSQHPQGGQGQHPERLQHGQGHRHPEHLQTGQGQGLQEHHGPQQPQHLQGGRGQGLHHLERPQQPQHLQGGQGQGHQHPDRPQHLQGGQGQGPQRPEHLQHRGQVGQGHQEHQHGRGQGHQHPWGIVRDHHEGGQHPGHPQPQHGVVQEHQRPGPLRLPGMPSTLEPPAPGTTSTEWVNVLRQTSNILLG